MRAAYDALATDLAGCHHPAVVSDRARERKRGPTGAVSQRDEPTTEPATSVSRSGAVLLSPESVLRLQREAGNGAVGRIARAAVSVQRAGPEPEAVQPPDGLNTLSRAGGEGQPLGQTDGRATLPQFSVVRTEGSGAGTWTGRVQAVPEPTTTIDARYPAPGAYRLDGRGLWVIVDDAKSEEVKAGEQEHSDDMDAAKSRAYGTPAQAINRLARQPAKSGPNIADVHRQWREALRRELPPQLRAPVADISPTGPWSHAYAALHGASLERDSQGKHTLGQDNATPAQRTRYAIPDDQPAKVVTGSIRRQPSSEVIDEAWRGLPTSG